MIKIRLKDKRLTYLVHVQIRQHNNFIFVDTDHTASHVFMSSASNANVISWLKEFAQLVWIEF